MSRRYVFCATLLLAGCSHKTPDQLLLKDVGPAISWVATLQFASQQWLADEVPGAYFRLTVKKAEKAFEAARRSVDESQASDALRREIRSQVEISHDIAQHLERAIEKGDRGGVAQYAQRLSSVSEVLERLHERESQ